MFKESIYVCHSTKTNFKSELYIPLRESTLNKKYNIILPHEESLELFNSKEALRNCRYVLAEVTNASLGVGIELGWADFFNIPIICLYKKGSHISKSLQAVSNEYIEYVDSKDMISLIEQKLKDF